VKSSQVRIPIRIPVGRAVRIPEGSPQGVAGGESHVRTDELTKNLSSTVDNLPWGSVRENDDEMGDPDDERTDWIAVCRAEIRPLRTFRTGPEPS
jgi:hypothetical protein